MNKVSRETDPNPPHWDIMVYEEEKKDKNTGSIQNGLATKKPMRGEWDKQGGREDATIRQD